MEKESFLKNHGTSKNVKSQTNSHLHVGSLRRRLSLIGATEPSSLLKQDVERHWREAVTDDKTAKECGRYVPTEWDDSLPYGGKVNLAKQKKPDTWLCFILQIVLVSVCVILIVLVWTHPAYLHFHSLKLAGSLGHGQSQSIIGHKFLHGDGELAPKNVFAALSWLLPAARNGDAHAAYNVAIAHLQGANTTLQKGEAKKWIEMAAEKGVPEAVYTMQNICTVDADMCDM